MSVSPWGTLVLAEDGVRASHVLSAVPGGPTQAIARNQLSNLLTYMDGKSGAEALITKALNDPGLLASIAAKPAPTASEAKED